MMQPCRGGLAAFIVVVLLCPIQAAERPNIVLILADDLGYSDFGCYGGEIETPNVDRLAAGGLRFTQFYNTARCCPTRAALLTGLYPHQAGIGHMTSEDERQRMDKGYPGYRGELNDECVTIAEVLGPAGYRTLMAGKWHVGTFPGNWPLDRGFEQYFGIIRGASNYFRPAPDKLLMHQRTPVTPHENFYTTDDFTDYAIRFVEECEDDDRPFFLYLAYTAPHWPLHAWEEDVAKYRGKYRIGWDAVREARFQRMIELGIIDSRWLLTERDAPAWDTLSEGQIDELDHRMAIYAAQVDRMDQNIGRVVDTLEELGESENTLVLFLADNGGCAEGGMFGGGPAEFLGQPKGYLLSYGKGWANASNTPFKRYKHWVHEGGIASPLVVHWPSRIEGGGALRHQPGHVIDLMATCLDVAGASYPKAHEGREATPLEGKSLVPAFDDRPIERDAVFWEHEGNQAVLRGKWKLVAAHDQPWELYDMEADRTEMHNLADAQPDIRDELAAMYDAWAARAHVRPWPVQRRPGYEPPKREYPPTYVDLQWRQGDEPRRTDN